MRTWRVNRMSGRVRVATIGMALVASAAAICVTSPGALGATRQSAQFVGTTSQLTPMSFTVDYDPGTKAFYVNRTTFELDLDCPSGQVYVVNPTFTSGAKVGSAGGFLAENLFPTQYDKWGGRFLTTTHARGKAHFEFPAFTPAHTVEVCSATVDWDAAKNP